MEKPITLVFCWKIIRVTLHGRLKRHDMEIRVTSYGMRKVEKIIRVTFYGEYLSTSGFKAFFNKGDIVWNYFLSFI